MRQARCTQSTLWPEVERIRARVNEHHTLSLASWLQDEDSGLRDLSNAENGVQVECGPTESGAFSEAGGTSASGQP